MTHTYTCSYDIVWHDLTEDPNDLPTDDYEEVYVLTLDPDTGELDSYFCYDPDRYGARYDSTSRVWTACEKAEWHAWYRVVAFRSFGIEPIDAQIKCYDVLSTREVVAWAEQIVKTAVSAYIPALYRKETNE